MVLVKSSKDDMAMRGYVYGFDKQEAVDVMADDSKYLIVDVTGDDLADTLPIIRALHKFTRKDLAIHLGRSEASISRYEIGKRKPKDSVTKFRLSSFITGKGVYSDRYHRFKAIRDSEED